jgi:hypothetical protein
VNRSENISLRISAGKVKIKKLSGFAVTQNPTERTTACP